MRLCQGSVRANKNAHVHTVSSVLSVTALRALRLGSIFSIYKQLCFSSPRCLITVQQAER